MDFFYNKNHASNNSGDPDIDMTGTGTGSGSSINGDYHYGGGEGDGSGSGGNGVGPYPIAESTSQSPNSSEEHLVSALFPRTQPPLIPNDPYVNNSNTTKEKNAAETYNSSTSSIYCNLNTTENMDTTGTKTGFEPSMNDDDHRGGGGGDGSGSGNNGGGPSHNTQSTLQSQNSSEWHLVSALSPQTQPPLILNDLYVNNSNTTEEQNAAETYNPSMSPVYYNLNSTANKTTTAIDVSNTYATEFVTTIHTQKNPSCEKKDKIMIELRAVDLEYFKNAQNHCLAEIKSALISYFNSEPVGEFATIDEYKDAFVKVQKIACDDVKQRCAEILEQYGESSKKYIMGLPNDLQGPAAAFFVKISKNLETHVNLALKDVRGEVKNRNEQLVKAKQSQFNIKEKVGAILKSLVEDSDDGVGRGRSWWPF